MNSADDPTSELDYWEKPLPADEFFARANAPLSEDVLRENLEAHAWFMKRYPSPFDRMRYSIRRYRQSMRFQADLRGSKK